MKNKTKSFRFILKISIAVFMAFMILFAMSSNTVMTAGPNGYISTDKAPDLEISTAAQLTSFATTVNSGNKFTGKKVVLTSNIVLPAVVNNISPIGTLTYPFEGEFDGRGFEISNLNLNITTAGPAGLFARATNAVIGNFTLRGSVSKTADGQLGAVVGTASGTTIIHNVINYATVYGRGTGGIGGIAGGGGIYISCANYANVNGNYHNGGITGDPAAMILNSYNRGTVIMDAVTSSTGGLTGYVSGTVIRNVLNTSSYTIGFTFEGAVLNNISNVYYTAYSNGAHIFRHIRDKANAVYYAYGSATYGTYMNQYAALGYLQNVGPWTAAQAQQIDQIYTLNDNVLALERDYPQYARYFRFWNQNASVDGNYPTFLKEAATTYPQVRPGTTVPSPILTPTFDSDYELMNNTYYFKGNSLKVTPSVKESILVERFEYSFNNKDWTAVPASGAVEINNVTNESIINVIYFRTKSNLAANSYSTPSALRYVKDASKVKAPDTKISTAQQLIDFSTSVNSGNNYRGKKVVLTNNIALSGAANILAPIGTNTYSFEGEFDGRGFTISGLNINVSAVAPTGLFGRTLNAVVGNFTLKGSVTNSAQSVYGAQTGGAVGLGTNSIIHNIISYVTVNAKVASDTGGVTGSSSVVISCANYGVVNGIYHNGGVAGTAGTILNCYNRGAISNTAASASTGGVIGYVSGSVGKNLFNTNSFTIGFRIDSQTTKISDVYNVGSNGTFRHARDINNAIYYVYGTAGYNNLITSWNSRGYFLRSGTWSDAQAKDQNQVYLLNDNVLSMMKEYPAYAKYLRFWNQKTGVDSGYPSFLTESAGIEPQVNPSTVVPAPTLTASFDSEYEFINNNYYFDGNSLEVKIALSDKLLFDSFEYSFTNNGSDWVMAPLSGVIPINNVTNNGVINTIYVRTKSIIGTYSSVASLRYIRDISGPAAPTLNVATVEAGKQPSNQEFYSYDVKVTINHNAALDGANGVGIGYYEYRINDQTTWTRVNKTVASIGVFSEQGSYKIYIRSVDELGNYGTEVLGTSFTIDKTPPSTPIIEKDYQGLWADEEANLTFINPETDVTYEYKLTVGNFTIIDWKKLDGNTLHFDDEGMYVIHVRATNQSGLVSAVKSDNLRVDKGAPTLTVTGNPTSWTNYVKLVAKAEDGDLGVGGIIYGWTEGLTEEDALDANVNWNNVNYLEVSRNNIYYVAWAKDALDNTTHEVIHVTRYDSVKPSSPEMQVQVLKYSKNNGATYDYYFLDTKAEYESTFNPLHDTIVIDGNTYLCRWEDVDTWTKGLNRVALKHGEDNSIDQVGIAYSHYMLGDSGIWSDPIPYTTGISYFYLEEDGVLLSGEIDIFGQTVDNNAVVSEDQLSYMRIVVARIDNVNPNTPAVDVVGYYAKDNDIYIANHTVKLVAVDSVNEVPADIHSGLERIEYKIGDGNWMTYDSSIDIPAGSDLVDIYFRSVDKVENYSETVMITILLDDVKPELDEFGADVPLDPVYGYLSISEILFSGVAIDNNSGIQKIEYSLDNYNWNNVTFASDGSFNFSIDVPGLYELFLRITDNAGNVLLLEPVDVLYTDDAPVITASVETGWKSSDKKEVAFSVSYNDFAVEYYYLSISNERPDGNSTWITLPGDDFLLDLESGTYYIWVMNELKIISDVTTFVVDKLDTTAPVITLAKPDMYSEWYNGEKKVYVTATDTESGIKGYYITSDSEDVPVSADVFESEIWIDINGTYYIYAIDNAGNISIDAYEVTESHIDLTAPEVTQVSVAEAVLYVNLVDEVTGSGIKGYYVSATEIPVFGLVNEVTNPNNVAIYAVGKVYVWAIDNAGNISSSPLIVTINSTDTTAPVIVTLNYDNANYVKGARDVYFKLSDNSKLYGYFITTLTTTPTIDDWILGSNITAQQVTEITEKLINGTYYLWVRDLSGNTTRSNAFTISKVDETAPAVTISYNPESGIFGREVRITLTATDSESGLAALSYRFNFGNGGTWSDINTFTVTSENTAVDIEVRDAVGNIYYIQVVIDWVDRTAPELSYTIPDEDVFTDTLKTVNFEASDVLSGLKGYFITSDSELIPTSDQYIPLNGNNVSFNVGLDNGTHYVYVMDNCGNIQYYIVEIDKVDTTLPEFEVSGNPLSFVTEANIYVINIEYGDPDSGAHPEGSVSFDGGATWTGNTEILINVNQELKIRVRDAVGNYSEKIIDITKVDGIAPVISLEVDGADTWTNTLKTVTFDINDGTGIGVYGYFITDNPHEIPDEFISYDGTFSKTYGSGTYYIYASDELDNISARTSFTISNIDNTDPTVSLSHDGGENLNIAVTLSDQGGSNLKGYYYSSSETSYENMTFVEISGTDINFVTENFAATSAGVWHFIALDHAGNRSSLSSIAVYGNMVDEIRGLINEIGHVTLDSGPAISEAEKLLSDYIELKGEEQALTDIGAAYINTLEAARDLFDRKVTAYNEIYLKNGKEIDEILYQGYLYYLSKEIAIKYSDAEGYFGAILENAIEDINKYLNTDEKSLDDIAEERLKEMKLVPLRYTISFNSTGGSYIPYLTGDENTEIDLSEIEIRIPEKLGYAFLYWAADIIGTEEYEFDVIPGENITLYAKWFLDLSGRFDKTLETVSLESGYSWVDAETVMNRLGKNQYEVLYDEKVYMVNVNVLKGIIDDITFVGISREYNESDSTITINNLRNGDQVEYMESDGTWSEQVPVFNEVVSATYFVRILRENYEIYTSYPINVVITQADIPESHFEITNVDTVYDGSGHSIIVSILEGEYEILYSTSGTWIKENPVHTDATEVIFDNDIFFIRVKLVNNDNPNYKSEREASGTIKILRADPEVNPVLTSETVYTSSSSLPEISLSEGDTEGIIKWDTYQIPDVSGNKKFAWTFTPSSVWNYNTLTGEIEIMINAVEQIGIVVSVNPELDNINIYTNTSLENLKQYLTVTKVFNDGKTIALPLLGAEYTLSPGELQIGDNVITITQNGSEFTTTFEVSGVEEYYQTGLRVDTTRLDATTIYTSNVLDDLKNIDPELSLIRVYKTFSDGTEIEIPADEYVLGTFNPWNQAETGKVVQVVAPVNDTPQFTALFTVDVILVVPTQIVSIEKRNVTDIIFTSIQNNELKEKLVVEVKYNDGTIISDLPKELFTISGSHVTAGEHPVFITLTENTALIRQIDITFTKPTAESIDITRNPNKMDYVAFETLRLDGLVLMVYYDDGSSHAAAYGEITVTYENLSNDSFRALETEVTLSYPGVSESVTLTIPAVKKATPIVTVNVEESSLYTTSASLPEISIASASTDGELNWNNATPTFVTGPNSYGWTFTPDDTDNYTTAEGSYAITVVQTEQTGIALNYTGEDVLYTSTDIEDLKTDLTVTGVYNDPEYRPLITAYSFDKTALVSGINTITVTEDGTGYHADFSVTALNVKPVEILSINLRTTDTIYTSVLNNELKTKLVVEVSYNDGTIVADLPSDLFTILGSHSTQDTHTIIVRLTENTACVDEIDIYFTLPSLLEIVITTPPTSIPVYKAFETIDKDNDLTGMVVTARYDDANTHIVPLSEITIVYYKDDTDSFRAGDMSVWLEYQGCNAELALPKVLKATPNISVIVESESIYSSASSLPVISLDSGLEYTPGVIEWNEALGGSKDYEWKFTPDDEENYEILYGDQPITVIPKAPERISVIAEDGLSISRDATDEDILDLKDFITATLIYNDGDEKELSDSEYTLTKISAGEDTITVKITLTADSDIYHEFTVDIKAALLEVIEGNTTFKFINISSVVVHGEGYVYNADEEVFLVGLALNDTLNLIVAQFTNKTADIRVWTKAEASGGALIDSGTFGTKAIATGMVLELVNSGGVVIDSITLVIRGDINGDGRVNAIDKGQANNHILKKTVLEGASMLACDTNGDGRVNAIDKGQVNNHILKKTDIHAGLGLGGV